MTQQGNSNSRREQDSLERCMIIGAGVGLLLISLFIIPAEANPAWGKLWMVRPLIVTPMAGAMSGLCTYFIVNFHERAGISKTIATVAGFGVLIVGLFVGLVLGMDGTLWD